MLQTYKYPKYPYRQSPEQRQGKEKHHPVVIIGAGPVGLTAALELNQQGIAALVLDDNNTVCSGSRAVSYAKRTLEIWDRLGVAAEVIDKGESWSHGRVFFKDHLAYEFDLPPEPGHKMPAMINLQQYYLEEFLVAMCDARDAIELRWQHKLISLAQTEDAVNLVVETPDGVFRLQADWVIACDGANSDTRAMVDGRFYGQFFHDRFLIADVLMKSDWPVERRFWFDPPFHRNRSALMHRQADNLWRLEFQLGSEVNPDEAKQPQNVNRLLRQVLGENAEFELEWVSVYQFACRRMDRFRYGRVLFAGDAAHQLSPFGARGVNVGVQDIDNLGWKLKMVMQGKSSMGLLDSYSDERVFAADDNLVNSTRSTEFISPGSHGSHIYRDAALSLARQYEFARPLVNSGRPSTPTSYHESCLNTPDEDSFAGNLVPGANCTDAPVRIGNQDAWFLDRIGGRFCVLVFGEAPEVNKIKAGRVSARVLTVGEDIQDHTGALAASFDAIDGDVYLLRPDQHIAARWRNFDQAKISRAIARACAQTGENSCH